MKRWLLAAVFALGCSEGQINDAGVAFDSGRTLVDWQRAALGAWRIEMNNSHDRMADYVDRHRDGSIEGGARASFEEASVAYRDAARTVVATDAGLDAQLALSTNYLTTVIFAAYCREVTAYVAATGMQPLQPAVRCGEPVPERWWERWPQWR